MSRKWYQMIADYAPAVSTSRTARSGRDDNALLNVSTFTVRVRLLDGSAVTGDVPAMHTVEQVKRDLFKQSPILAPLSKDSFYLALSADEVLTNEGALFVYSSDVITRALQDRSTKLELHVTPKAAVPSYEIQPTDLARTRPADARDGMGSATGTRYWNVLKF